MLLFDRENWPRHRPWVVVCTAVTVVAIAWYAWTWRGASARPGGSSLPGFTFGVVGGLICLFEFLLWPRKKLRTWHIGRVKTWMTAHIWLGLLSLPILVLHSGFTFGGTLSTVLMWLFLIVIASGVWGLALQQSLPKKMLHDIPAETIYSQINYIRKQFRDEGERLVLATCGPPEEEAPRTTDQREAAAPAPHLVVGAVRSVGRVQGKVLETRTAVSRVPESEPLRVFFQASVAHYLCPDPLYRYYQQDPDDRPRREPRDDGPRSPLRDPRRSAIVFDDIRTRLRPAAHPAVDALEGLCNQRRQLDEQARLHFWLHNWLCLHLPLSVALIVLMFVHIWYALIYA